MSDKPDLVRECFKADAALKQAAYAAKRRETAEKVREFFRYKFGEGTVK